MITAVTKSDSATVTVSQYFRDDLPLPSFGGKRRGKRKRGDSPSIWILSLYCCNLSIDQGSCRSVPIYLDRATYLGLTLLSMVYGFQVCLLIPVLLR
jgi:hypothetical protein